MINKDNLALLEAVSDVLDNTKASPHHKDFWLVDVDALYALYMAYTNIVGDVSSPT